LFHFCHISISLRAVSVFFQFAQVKLNCQCRTFVISYSSHILALFIRFIQHIRLPATVGFCSFAAIPSSILWEAHSDPPTSCSWISRVLFLRGRRKEWGGKWKGGKEGRPQIHVSGYATGSGVDCKIGLIYLR